MGFIIKQFTYLSNCLKFKLLHKYHGLMFLHNFMPGYDLSKGNQIIFFLDSGELAPI